MDKQIQDIIVNLSNDMLVIERIMESKKIYEDAIDKYYGYLKQGFEVDELRHCHVHFRFREDSAIHSLRLTHFVTNLMLWEPFISLGGAKIMDERYIYDAANTTAQSLKGYIDTFIIDSPMMIKNTKKNKIIHDMLYKLSMISYDFNTIMGLSINMETFMQVANRNPRFNELIRTKFPDNMQPSEIESALDVFQDEFVKILMVEDNFLKPILTSGTGIKHKQLVECAVNGGYKPDLNGDTIPIPINGNFLVGGMSNVTNHYIDSNGGRKSLIMNKTEMGTSGHFARMIMLLTTDVKTRKDTEKCNTINPIYFDIKTKKHLNKLKGRSYRTFNSREYHVLKGDEMDLIGSTIMVKSPITCTSKEGVCKCCYGDTLFEINKELNSIGGFAGTVLTEPVSQNILSSKHLLTTNSETVTIENDDIDVFAIFGNEVTLDSSVDSVDFKKLQLLIKEDDLEQVEQFDDDDALLNSFVPKFYVRELSTKNIHEITEKSGKNFYLSQDLNSIVKFKDGVCTIPFEKLENMGLFIVEISNNELTKPLYNIMDLLNSKARLGVETIHEMAQTLLDLIIESGIEADSVHLETIIRCLVRSSDDILEFPDFSSYTPKYQLLTVSAALEKNPSVLISLSFQTLKRQLSDPITFDKHSDSYIDKFFD